MKIVCIGRNYANHAQELKNEIPQEPIFFLKPDSALLPYKNPLYIPEWTQDLHYEVELVVRFKKLGRYIQKKFAHKYYDAVGVGIDFTARDIQQICKNEGLPWEKAKAFDGSAAVSKEFISLKDTGKKMDEFSFSLEKNGEKMQVGHASDMLFHVDELIEYCSQFMTFKIGDLLFTGTPSGVGRVDVGDELRCFLDDQEKLRLKIK